MEENLSLPQQIVRVVRGNLLVSILFSIGLICLVVGLIQYFTPSQESIELVAGEEVKGENTRADENISIFVDVSGEVFNPGLFELIASSRVKDALDKAGGVTPLADTEYIAKHLNLASKLSDGDKIYIPQKGEESVENLLQASQHSDSTQASSLISINNSSTSELETLPGVGEVTASKIINGRPYGSIQELLEKKVVGNATYQKIKDLVSL